MSGFTDDVPVTGTDILLRKPFKPADLLAHVQRALEVGTAPGQR
jgi:hypothetical protein